MCKVDGGSFGFGEGRVQTTVRGFYIDQFEVSVGQAVRFLNDRRSNECAVDAGLANAYGRCIGGLGLRLTAITQRADGLFEAMGGTEGAEGAAMLGFTVEGALAYCAWAGKRVPSSAQWEFAAGHDPVTNQDRRYPWGDQWAPRASCWEFAACNSPPKPAFGRSWIGRFDGLEGRSDGSSPWGLQDAVGGTSELVFECARPDDTCTIGQPCECRALEAPSDGDDPEKLVVTARRSLGRHGLRCARPL